MFQVNFLPWRENKLKKNSYFWSRFFLLQLLLSVIGTLLISFSLQDKYQQQEITLNILSKKYDKLQNIHQAIQQKLIDLQHIQSGIKIYKNVHQKTKNYLALLNQLSNFIPEYCWLVAIKQQEQILLIDGISHDYNSIILFIEKLHQKILRHHIELQKIHQKENGHFYFTIKINEPWSL